MCFFKSKAPSRPSVAAVPAPAPLPAPPPVPVAPLAGSTNVPQASPVINDKAAANGGTTPISAGARRSLIIPLVNGGGSGLNVPG